jgi:hypothetical protein
MKDKLLALLTKAKLLALKLEAAKPFVAGVLVGYLGHPIFKPLAAGMLDIAKLILRKL